MAVGGTFALVADVPELFALAFPGGSSPEAAADSPELEIDLGGAPETTWCLIGLFLPSFDTATRLC